MKLKPDDCWQWQYDSEQDKVMLDFNSGLPFCSRFTGKMLIPDAFSSHPFCVDDAALFSQLEESCRDLPLEECQRRELILNSLVAQRFLKPQMPKSWHFVAGRQAHQPEVGTLISVDMVHCEHQAVMLVIESNPQASLCIVAQETLELSSGKSLHLGEAIKIMNDRLKPWQPEHALFYEQVG